MRPDTRYVVEPWAVRGYQSVHGSVIFTVGALALIYAVVTMLEISLQPLWSRVFTVLMGVGTVGAAWLYGGSEASMGGGVVGWLVAIFGGYIAAKAARATLTSLDSTARAGVMLGTAVAVTLLLNFLVLGESRTALPWVWIAVATVFVLGLAVTGKHPQLSSNRMLIYMAAGGWTTIAVSAAAARVNLLAAQVEQSGTSLVGDYNDTQVTSGYFLALLGMLIVLVGAISMWASRRDIIINQERAERQRAAAEASAAEIRAALELAQAHQRQARTARGT